MKTKIIFITALSILIGSFSVNTIIRQPNGLMYPFLLRFDMMRNIAISETITDLTELSEATAIIESVQYIIVHHDEIEHARFNHAPITEIYNFHVCEHGHFAYHYYISEGGSIYKMHKEDRKLPHTGAAYNNKSIAICMAGNFDIDKPTSGQLFAYRKLINNLHMRYPSAQIIGHRDAGSKKTCPGFNFNYLDF